MGRSGKRDQHSGVRRITQIELSDKNRKLRIILLIVFLTIAVIAFTIGLTALLETEPGWTLVESNASKLNCSADFVFSYCYGQGEESATDEKKRLTTLYSEATEDAWRIFNEDLVTVCEQVNQTVTVDPALYKALSQVQKYGNRCLYLAPVYTEYNRIFISSTEAEAAMFDPGQNEELVDYIAKLAGFANDPSMVDLQLLENNQVRLMVAPEYCAFAEENEITVFLDFGWMTNAFIADYLADTITAAGFTNGFLSSYDGFTRNLDTRGEQFSLNLFDRRDTSIYLAGTMQYDQPIAIVFLRDYPMSQRDQYHYYPFSSGRIVTAFIDPADGMSKSSTDSLVSYSYQGGCVDILLQQSPVFLADALDVTALNDLRQVGIYSLWLEDTVLYCNDSSLKVELNPESGVPYTLCYTD